jgi:methionine-rich copper-binding protein CopC
MYSTALLAASHLTPEGNTEDPRDLPVRLVLKRCADFGKGCAALGNDNNPTSLAILARAILENLILILWVTKSEENAKELQDAAIAELKRAARINLERGKAKIMNRVTGEDATEKILADDQFKKLPKRKSVEARAGEAGVEDLYHIFYRFLSLDTHGHELNLAEGKNALDLAVMHMQGIGALLKATGHAGTIWLQARKRMDNETLRSMLGL